MAGRLALLSTGLLAITAHAGNVLTSNGYQLCQEGGDLQIKTLAASFDRTTRVLSFDVAGASSKSQNVSAILSVSAYGQEVYKNQFNPCDFKIAQLCPVPATNFSASGNQTIPEEFANRVPDIAYSIPDLDGTIKLQIIQSATSQSVGCIQASITNGKTVSLPAIQYVGLGIAVAALLASGIAAIVSGHHPGASGISPSFADIVGWFQSMAMNGMLSVNYPPIYRSFTSNFGFSTGLVSWSSMQQTIDNFRASTGGNLTNDNYDYLKNVTLVFPNGANNETSFVKRALPYIVARDGPSLSLSADPSASGKNISHSHFVSGIQAYAEQLTIPQANTFMTLLLMFALVVAGLIVLVLLLKAILELWNLAHPLPKSLESWRRRYWWRLAKAITGLVIIFYGIWTMYCIYQFTNGDSWAAKLLAGLSLGLFTILIAGFIFRIVYKARQLKRIDGDVSKLYEDKETWIKYSLFYDSFKRTYWWIFVPLIIGSAARGAIIAGANGRGLVQTIGHIVIDVLLLALLIWTRPYQSKSGNIINIIIQIVRVLSIGCILVFVESLGVNQTAKTIVGFVLVIIQAILTGLLAILLAINAIIFCIRENPERRRRKQAEKMDQEFAEHNALLMRDVQGQAPIPHIMRTATWDKRGNYGPVPGADSPSAQHARYPSDASYHSRSHSNDQLIPNAANMGWREGEGHLPAQRRMSELSLSDIEASRRQMYQ